MYENRLRLYYKDMAAGSLFHSRRLYRANLTPSGEHQKRYLFASSYNNKKNENKMFKTK